MGKRIKARVPEVVTRDPAAEPVEKAERKRYDGPVPAIYVPIVTCPHKDAAGNRCGGTVWRNGGSTRANPMTREMVRWRVCIKCGKSHWQRHPMDARQIAEYCPPDIE